MQRSAAGFLLLTLLAGCAASRKMKSSPTASAAASSAAAAPTRPATPPGPYPNLQRLRDPETGTPMFVGRHTIADLRVEPGFEWMRTGEQAYEPRAAAVSYLAGTLPAYSMVVLMGTWCPDSHRLIPQLQRVLQAAAYPEGQLALYSVDRSKNIPGNNLPNRYALKNVPTIILFDGEREVGRIVESVSEPVEEVLAAMLRTARGEDK